MIDSFLLYSDKNLNPLSVTYRAQHDLTPDYLSQVLSYSLHRLSVALNIIPMEI